MMDAGNRRRKECHVTTSISRGRRNPDRDLRAVTGSGESGFLRDALAALAATPKAISPKYFYDARGSRLFEEITQLPEYYLTRAEVEILQRRRREIAVATGRTIALIEYGSGSSVKTRLLLSVLGRRSQYVPIDISPDALHEASTSIATDYPLLEVSPVCGDYMLDLRLPAIRPSLRRVVFFPGSTIGNLEMSEAAGLLKRTRGLLHDGDSMLVGVDLLKERSVIEAAYNDTAGVTAEFNLNLLLRMNSELGADFDLDAFEHLAFFNEVESRIEMHLRSRRRQTVTLAGERFEFAAGETIHTESSHKYSRESFTQLAASAEFKPASCWTDPAETFALFLLSAA
jgi:dimethylhistidine N-methyltransferase